MKFISVYISLCDIHILQYENHRRSDSVFTLYNT